MPAGEWLTSGTTVSHYRIVEKLGGGGMGVVYRAEDLSLGREVALKFLPEDIAHDRIALERFEREARAAAAVNHPNICTVYEVGEHEGRPFLAMELLEGQTLKHHIDGKTGKMPFERKTFGAVMGAILHETPLPPSQINPELPQTLEEIINKGLEKDRDLRYQNATELRRDLKRLKRDFDSGQISSSSRIRVRPARRKRPWTLVGSGAIAVIAAAVIGFIGMRPIPPPRILATKQITNDPGTTIAYETDGTRLYYTLWAGYNVFENFQVSVKGGESVPLPDYTRGMILQDISPDKTELLFLKTGSISSDPGPWPLWVAPILGGALRRLGDLVATFGASWAPDGQELVYIKGQELHLATRDGAELRRLAVITGTPTGPPHWSPDGSRIRFDVRDASKSTSIWEISRDGTNLYALLPAWHGSYCCGSWTADGKYFVFSSGGNIWAIREKTRLFQRARREPVQLTTGPMQLQGPMPSPDGKRLFAGGWEPRSELVRYDSKSGQFLPYLRRISAEGLDFSRKGRWVAYILYPEGTLWRANADGSARQQLTFPPFSAGMPRWSPDGKQIALEGALPGKPWRIYLLSSEGGTPLQVTNGESGDAGDFDPVWSPDGSLLAFGGNPFLLHAPAKLMIHVLNANTRRISGLPGSEGLWSPRWSPTGNYIAALSAANQKLMLYDLRTHRQTELANGDIGYPSWSHDGEFVYFDTIGSDPTFYRVRIRDRKKERTVSLEDVHRSMGTFGPWTGVAPDGSLLVQRDAGTSEIYSLDWEAP